MLSYFQFLLLNRDQKEHYLIQKGTFLLSHTQEKKEVSLYALSDFFVELHKDQQKKASEIVAFKCLNRLSQHVKHVNLDELYA